MIQTRPEALQHALNMLYAIRMALELGGMPEQAGVGEVETPAWITEALVGAYINLNGTIHGFEAHLTQTREQKSA